MEEAPFTPSVVWDVLSGAGAGWAWKLQETEGQETSATFIQQGYIRLLLHPTAGARCWVLAEGKGCMGPQLLERNGLSA